jgi:hypothetical protein
MQEYEAFKLPGSKETLGFDVDKHQWLPVKGRCCVKINGLLCGLPAQHEASKDRLDRAALSRRAPQVGTFTYDSSSWLIFDKQRWVCGDHVYDLCRPCLKPANEKATSNTLVQRRDFLRAVDKVAEAATPAPEPALQPRRRRYTTGSQPQQAPHVLGQLVRVDRSVARLRGFAPKEAGSTVRGALFFVQAERGGARLYHQGRGGEWHERGPALDAALFGSERDVPRHFATHRPPPPD